MEQVLAQVRGHNGVRGKLKQPARTTAMSIGLLFVYYETYRWVPLGKWNWQFRFPVVNDQSYPDLVIGALLLWFTWSFFKAKKPGMWAGSLLVLLWVVVHFFDWWLPYAENLPSRSGRFFFYKSHTQILPVIGNHYPPDAGHAVLDFILFLSCFLAIRTLLKQRSH